MRNPLLYRKPGTNEGIVSYYDDIRVTWTQTINDVPQTPYRHATLLEFKMIIENGNWELDENTVVTFTDGEFKFIERKKYWK